MYQIQLIIKDMYSFKGSSNVEVLPNIQFAYSKFAKSSRVPRKSQEKYQPGTLSTMPKYGVDFSKH